MSDVYQQILSTHQLPIETKMVLENETRFTDWLKKQINRDSPLGDLAQDMAQDKTWPNYSTLDEYRAYLYSKNASWQAIESLERAWRAYRAFLTRKSSPKPDKQKVKNSLEKKRDPRTIVSIKNAEPLNYNKRTVETFKPGDKAWISWDGRKAIPVTVEEADERHYSVKIERPHKKAGNRHSLFLDEVRSTPELACTNLVTL